MQSASSTSPDPGGARAVDNPFVDARFLAALEACGCIGPARGWTRVAVEAGRGFAPAWLKDHSHGEFVFDHVWADAAHRAGIPWYPKLLVASPLSPVPGPRLIAPDRQGREALAEQLVEITEQRELSSCAINFCDEADRDTLDADERWLERGGWQFHWHNRGWADFEDFLGALRAKPRKNIRRERRLAHDAGLTYRWVHGSEMHEAELDLIAECYAITFALYGNLPLLNREFFATMAREFGDDFLACIVSRHGRDEACAVFWKSATRLYGRYWGSRCESRDVHFEACYYQGIEYCIEHGLQAFEPGAQGEHKIRRGFVPIRTRSFHLVRHPGMRRAIADWLVHEQRALAEYRERLREFEPYREAEAG